MKIVIEKTENEQISVEFVTNAEDNKASYEDVVAMLMGALDAVTVKFIKKLKPADELKYKDHLYDLLDNMFGRFLKKVFPEIKIDEFNLSAAAIVYAEDQIIQKAEAEGKTYAEMLDEYNELANEYIKERRKLS